MLNKGRYIGIIIDSSCFKEDGPVLISYMVNKAIARALREAVDSKTPKMPSRLREALNSQEDGVCA